MKLYREATFKDGLKIINKLRPDDKAEVEGRGFSVLHVPFSLEISEFPTVFFSREGEVAGIAGVGIYDNTKIGQIWMLCTPVIEKHPITFVRGAKSWLKEIEGNYKLLWNIVDARNKGHHKLLKHLGFKALQTVPTGPMNLPYYEIVKTCAYQP